MTDTIPPDHYAALGLSKDASVAQVKTAYKKAALKFHPDKAKDKDTAADQFHKISVAYETLVDDEKRRKYLESVKLAQLKRELQDRRGPSLSSYGPSSNHGRAPSYSNAPRSPYATPGAFPRGGVYEERRPRDKSWDDEYFPRQEETRASSRKYPEYMSSPKQSSRPTSSRQDDVRRPSRDEGFPSRSKASTSSKQREQTIKRDRYAKRYVSPSVESDTSGSDDETAQRRRRDAYEQDFDRRAAPPRRAGEIRESGYDQAREYMNRNAVHNRSPAGSRSPPPYRREAFQSHQMPTRDRPQEPRRDSHEARPPLRRNTSTRQSESYAPVNRSRPNLTREDSGARKGSYVADDDRRPPLRPSESISSPPGGGKVPQVSTNTRRSTAPDEHNKAPKLARRSETAPNLNTTSSTRATPHPPPNSSRRRSEQPQQIQQPLHGPSGLRSHQENINDSGYSTSSPSEEAPPKKENHPNPKRHANQHSTNIHEQTDSDPSSESEDERPAQATSRPTNFRNGSTTEIRTPGGRRAPSISRSPSPLGERNVPRSRANSSSSIKHHMPSHGPSTAQRTAPPPSNSTKWAHDHFEPSSTTATHGSASDRDRDHPASRASLRRPSISRSYSAKSNLNRANSMPIRPTLTTSPTIHASGSLYGEVTQTESPVDYQHRSDGEGKFGSSDRERDLRRRATEDLPKKRQEDARSIRGKRDDFKMRDTRGFRDTIRERTGSPRVKARA